MSESAPAVTTAASTDPAPVATAASTDPAPAVTAPAIPASASPAAPITGSKRGRDAVLPIAIPLPSKDSIPPAATFADAAALAVYIGGVLSETNLDSISLTSDTIGVPATLTLLGDTLDTEAAGGQMTADGLRRRTPGGVFFSLLKSRVSDDTYKGIFVASSKRASRAKAAARREKQDAARAGAGLPAIPPPASAELSGAPAKEVK